MASHGKGSLLQGIDQQQSGAPKAPAAASGASKKNVLVIALCLLSLAALVFVIIRSFSGGESAASVSERRTLIDSVTGELFEDFRIPDGKAFPYAHPKTGAATLYPAEPCFYSKDGGVKDKPTWVLLNQYAGKEGQTICPDCGKPVRAHNPYPEVR